MVIRRKQTEVSLSSRKCLIPALYPAASVFKQEHLCSSPVQLSFTRPEAKTAFTRCRHILKTVKNVTAAKFELAFTRCRHNLKTVGKLTVRTRSWTLMLKKSTYTLRIDQSRSKSVEK